MEHLKVLQATLTQTCDVICNTYGLSRAEVFTRTEAFIRENSERWRQPDPDINYENPFCRMAYIYMNVAVHAHLIEQALSSFSQTRDLICSKVASGDELRVCALGGGPGSELLGLVTFIENLRPTEETVYLDFTLVDCVKEWDESWHALKQGIDEQLRAKHGINRGNWPVLVSRSFLPLDATSLSDFKNFATRFSGTDLFMFSYFVSELKALVKEFGQVLDLLIARSSPGALTLFVDRNEREVREIVQQLVRDNQALTSLGLRKERGRLEVDLADLGEWYIHIPSLPRQKWLAFFALAQREETPRVNKG